MNRPLTNDPGAVVLPDIIQRYLQSRDEVDTDATLRTFSVTAEVTDEGEVRHGHDEIRRWLETTSSEYTFERTLIGVSSAGDAQWVVVNNR